MSNRGRHSRSSRRIAFSILLLLSLPVYLGAPVVSAQEATGPTGASGSTGSTEPSATGPTGPVGPSGATGPAPTPVEMDSIIARLRAGLSAEEQADVITRHGGVEVSSIPVLRLHVVEVPLGEGGGYLDAYGSDPDVESAERDKVRETEAIPDDPDYGSQWALPQIGWEDA